VWCLVTGATILFFSLDDFRKSYWKYIWLSFYP